MSKRKVRKDFDKSQPITVDVTYSSVEEKKKVQQAFFDIGIKWAFSREIYGSLKESFYTNVTSVDDVISTLMWAERENLSSIADPITPEEFFAMVYEDEPQGHPHAELMMQYAEDAKTHAEPWKLWQVKVSHGKWRDLTCDACFAPHLEYRRKPKTHLVHGVEVPDLRIKPSMGDRYYAPYVSSEDLVIDLKNYDDGVDMHHKRCNLCYEYTEAGRQAAILHAKAMLGIADK